MLNREVHTACSVPPSRCLEIPHHHFVPALCGAQLLHLAGGGIDAGDDDPAGRVDNRILVLLPEHAHGGMVRRGGVRHEIPVCAGARSESKIVIQLVGRTEPGHRPRLKKRAEKHSDACRCPRPTIRCHAKGCPASLAFMSSEGHFPWIAADPRLVIRRPKSTALCWARWQRYVYTLPLGSSLVSSGVWLWCAAAHRRLSTMRYFSAVRPAVHWRPQELQAVAMAAQSVATSHCLGSLL
mmetsp:Transcript_869/g.1868  ORF Transcript_869/g.1868 Transcript_869/m.1868 type:complete len:239 (-) Transcript_869:48-764(-)